MKKHAGTALLLGIFAAASATGCAAGSGVSDSGDDVSQEQEAIIAPIGAVAVNGCSGFARFDIQSSNALTFVAVNSDQLQAQDVALSLFSVSSSGTSQLATQAQTVSNAMASRLNQMTDSLTAASNFTTSDRLSSANSVTAVDQHQSSAASTASQFGNSANASQTGSNAAWGNSVNTAAARNNNLVANNQWLNNFGMSGLGGGCVGVCGGVGGLGTFSNSSMVNSAAQSLNDTASTAATSTNTGSTSFNASSQNSAGFAAQSTAARNDSVVVTSTSALAQDHLAATNSTMAQTHAASLLDQGASSFASTAVSTSANTQAFTNLSSQQIQHYMLQVRMNSMNNQTSNLWVYAGGQGGGIIGTAALPVAFAGCGI